jgi:ferrochelatase
MSFHGVPRRTLELGDPYHCECLVTARRLAERLGLSEDRWVVTFQSRFGKAEWLQPYTEPTLIALAESGVRSVDVVCPGFVSDCLETLEEIAMEAKHAFTEAGGTDFNYLGCLNDSPAFIASLADIVSLHTAGWPMSIEQGPDAQALADRAQRARRLGAKA